SPPGSKDDLRDHDLRRRSVTLHRDPHSVPRRLAYHISNLLLDDHEVSTGSVWEQRASEPHSVNRSPHRTPRARAQHPLLIRRDGEVCPGAYALGSFKKGLELVPGHVQCVAYA